MISSTLGIWTYGIDDHHFHWILSGLINFITPVVFPVKIDIWNEWVTLDYVHSLDENIPMHTHTSILTTTNTLPHTRKHIHTHTHTHTHTCTHAHTHTHAHAHTHTRTHTHTHTHTHKHTHTHTFSHTYIPPREQHILDWRIRCHLWEPLSFSRWRAHLGATHTLQT